MMLTTLQFMFFCFRVLLICSLFFSKPTCNSAHTGRALLPRSFFFVIGIHAVHYFPLLLQRPIPIPPCLQRGPRTCPDPY